MIIAGSVLAAFITPVKTHAETTTKGEATFEADSSLIVEPIKPGTETPVEPENPITQEVVSNVHLVYVPGFNFGLNKTSLQTKNYSAKYMTYKKDGTTYEIPQFLQVADLSGKEGTRWAVTAEQQTPFTSADAAEHVLTNSRIVLKGASVTNNLNEANAAAMVNPVQVESILPVKNVDGGPLEVFSAKAGTTGAESTNGTISSMVFSNNYDEANYTTTAAANVNDRGTNADVQLKLEQTDKVQLKEYKADIVWTLTVTP